MSKNNYNPAGCEHKLPNGFGAWVFQSEETGSGEDYNYSVHVVVCRLCGTIRVAGFRQDNKGKLNRFSEMFDIHATDAIDAIVKYANYIHEEEVWCRRKEAQTGAVWVKGGPTEQKKHFARVPSCLDDNVIYPAIIIPIKDSESWWAVGDQFKFTIHRNKIIEYLDESGTAATGVVWIKGEYDRLYDQLKVNSKKRIACFVDYEFKYGDNKTHVCRDICTIIGERMEFVSRGHGYGSVEFMPGDEKTNFIGLCTEMNVEWLCEGPAAVREEDAVGFAEWLDKERNEKRPNWSDMKIWGKANAFAQLYELFKQQKDQ